MLNQHRRHWMSVLARADAATLAIACKGLLPNYTVLRGPEAGLIMLRGRMGGDGQPFNLGEATVTRCIVRIEIGHVGQAYCLGRGLQQAELAAVIDAALQDVVYHESFYQSIIWPIEAAYIEKRDQAARRAAATQVNFFTMSTMRT